MTHRLILVVSLLLTLCAVAADAPKPATRPARARAPKPNAGQVMGENRATPIDRIRVAKDFKVELLYSVPNAEQGSWINLTTDDKGRIIASDQYGGLYRFPAPALGQPLDAATIEKVPAAIRGVNGMLWHDGVLYCDVNDYENKMEGGLYKVSSSKNDDTLDKVEHLFPLKNGADHGNHAVLLAPDGKALYLIIGDRTPIADYTTTDVPRVWGEDHLLPRMPDGRGFMRDVLGPGGAVYRVSFDGKQRELVAAGFRNIFDAAFDADGELFTYDADMEYDYNTSWYRPTRICHVVSGAEFGWRNGAGKRPEWYPDNLPPVLNVGPGSPTGMTFGYGAKFPGKYQNAMFGLDWSWGKLYAIFLKPDGATYSATKEEFLSGAPMPLTDVIIHPKDGAMYFLIGGRKVQSGLYRVTYTGSESTAHVDPPHNNNPEAALRKKLEAFHGHVDPAAVSEAWPHLADKDRFIRWAARTAVEFQPLNTWADRALSETNPGAQVEALLALVRCAGIDPQHRKPGDPAPDLAMRDKILAALGKIDWEKLTDEQRITLVRDYEICFVRCGRPDDAAVSRVIAQLDPHFPAQTFPLNWELCETLVYLQSPTAAAKGMALISAAATQEEQIEYARSLRMLKEGWTPETHRAFFQWMLKAANYRGGASFEKFLEFIRTDAVANLTAQEKVALKDVLEAKPQKQTSLQALAAIFKDRTPHEWTLDELSGVLDKEGGLKHRNFENGRKMFGAAGCFTCHRFNNEGGMTGPDLSTAGARYSPRDFLDNVVNPSKVINDQFVPWVIKRNNGPMLTGVIVNLNGDTVTINTDAADPNERTSVDRKDIKSIEMSKVSPMPEGLLNLLTKDEILDLAAYALSGGDPKNDAFKK